MSIFDVLPDELLLNIFSHLSPLDLCKASRVCKYFHAFANDRQLWENIYGIKGEDAKQKSIQIYRFKTLDFSSIDYPPSQFEECNLAPGAKRVVLTSQWKLARVESVVNGTKLFDSGVVDKINVDWDLYKFYIRNDGGLVVYDILQNTLCHIPDVEWSLNTFYSKNYLWISKSHRVGVYNLRTGKKVANLRSTLPNCSLSVSANEKWMVMFNQRVGQLWSVRERKSLLRYRVERGDYRLHGNYFVFIASGFTGKGKMWNFQNQTFDRFSLEKYASFIDLWNDHILYTSDTRELFLYSLVDKKITKSCQLVLPFCILRGDFFITYSSKFIKAYDLSRDFDLVIDLTCKKFRKIDLEDSCLLIRFHDNSTVICNFDSTYVEKRRSLENSNISLE